MANVAAEFAFLAGLCKNPDIYFNIQQHVSADDFSTKAHQKFFIVLQRLLMNATGDLKVTRAGLLAEASALGFGSRYGACILAGQARDGEG